MIKGIEKQIKELENNRRTLLVNLSSEKVEKFGEITSNLARLKRLKFNVDKVDILD